MVFSGIDHLQTEQIFPWKKDHDDTSEEEEEENNNNNNKTTKQQNQLASQLDWFDF